MDENEMVRRLATLTPDNLKVFDRLVTDEMVPKEIALDLKITRRTVAYHMAEIYRRLGLVETGEITRFIWLGRFAQARSHIPSSPEPAATPATDVVEDSHRPVTDLQIIQAVEAEIPSPSQALVIMAPAGIIAPNLMSKRALSVALHDAKVLDRQRSTPRTTRLLQVAVLTFAALLLGAWSSGGLVRIVTLVVRPEPQVPIACPPQLPRVPLSARPSGYTATIDHPQLCTSGVQAGQAVVATGAINGDLTAHDIWLLIAAPNGELYPQSPDACRGLPARIADGRWENKVTFGSRTNRATPYDLIVGVAATDSKASFVLKEWLQSGCAEPARFGRGLTGAQLPDLLELTSTSIITKHD